MEGGINCRLHRRESISSLTAAPTTRAPGRRCGV
jgi:hypothetical protein